MRPFNLVQKFSVLGCVCIWGLCVALGLGISCLLERRLREVEWLSTADIVRYALEEHNFILDLIMSQESSDGAMYRQALQGLERLPEVVRIKVWNRKTTVLWSSDGQLIGRSFPENQEVKQALAGRVEVKLKSLRQLEQKYGREQFTHLAEIYVPVRANPSSEILGLVEVYKVPTRLLGELRRTRVLVWGIVLAGGLLLNFGLLWARELKAANQRLEDLSIQDGLTGLYNYREFHGRLAAEVVRAWRYDRPFSLLLLDIDHFKAVNDSLGHLAGDEILRALAALIQQEVRPTDQAARVGGDEFAILLPETSGVGALVMAERVRTLLASRTIPVPAGERVTITVSIGVATFPKDAQSGERLIDAADQALYAAKHTGRDRVCQSGNL